MDALLRHTTIAQIHNFFRGNRELSGVAALQFIANKAINKLSVVSQTNQPTKTHIIVVVVAALDTQSHNHIVGQRSRAVRTCFLKLTQNSPVHRAAQQQPITISYYTKVCFVSSVCFSVNTLNQHTYNLPVI